MADQGDLTDSQSESILAWFKQKFPKGLPCICKDHNQEWNMAGSLYSPVKFTEAKLRFSGQFYPQILLICSNCGHVRSFSAISMGLFDEVSTKSQEEREEQDVKHIS